MNAQEAKDNYGSISNILNDIKRVSVFSFHANITGGSLSLYQKKKLEELGYRIEDCNWLTKIFRNRHNKIYW